MSRLRVGGCSSCDVRNECVCLSGERQMLRSVGAVFKTRKANVKVQRLQRNGIGVAARQVGRLNK